MLYKLSQRFVFCLLMIALLVPSSHALSPQVKVIAITSGYGAVAGTLVGLASMAFGTKSKAIFVGASLGLYAGILTGAYLVMYPPENSREVPNREDDIYPNERYNKLLLPETEMLARLSHEKQKPVFHLPLVQVIF